MVIHKENGQKIDDCFYCKHFMENKGVRYCCQGKDCEEIKQTSRSCMMFEWRGEKSGVERK